MSRRRAPDHTTLTVLELVNLNHNKFVGSNFFLLELDNPCVVVPLTGRVIQSYPTFQRADTKPRWQSKVKGRDDRKVLGQHDV